MQIVDLYVQLQIQDGLEDIAPLYLTLSTTTRFAFRFNYLHRAVSEGKGFSKLSILQQTNEEIQDTNAPDLVTIEAESQSEPEVKEKSHSSVSIGPASKIGSQESLYGLVGKHGGVDHYSQTTGLSSQDSNGDSKERELSEQANPHQLKDQTSSSSVESSIDNVRNPGIPGNFTNIPGAKQTEGSQISLSKTVTTVPTQEEKSTFEDGDLVIDDHEDFPIPDEAVLKSPLGSLPEPVVSIQAPESPSVFDEARNHSRYSNKDWSQGSTQRPYIGDNFRFRGTKAEAKEIQINSLQDNTTINFARQVGTKESNDKDTSTVIDLDTQDEGLRGARKLSISQGYNANIDNETDINNHHDSLDSTDFISVHGTLNKYDELSLAHELVRENSKASGSDILEINNLDYGNQITGNSVIEDISNPKADDIVLAGAFDSEHISEAYKTFVNISMNAFNQLVSGLIPKCQRQTNFQIGSFSDCDEITYDEDENHYEDLKEIYFEHDMNSKLGLLKRVRNDTAESPMVCSDHQGNLS